jgi:phosphoribosylaminoimidazole-succinocarboxamide synthase
MTSVEERLKNLISSGLWPESKKINTDFGDAELIQLGYIPFYSGKNGDLYLSPHDINQALLVRSDRCSVNDIPLSDTISGKGIIQNSLSYAGAMFAENNGVKTAVLPMLDEIPSHIEARAQYIELCKPLEMEYKGETVGLELIWRNYITGSLFNLFKKGEDPYGLNLPLETKEWDHFSPALFTPTTKGASDDPIVSQLVRDKYPEIISTLEELFKEFTQHCYELGIIIVDTKFEVFIDSHGNWLLGDEILTPESSRFILVSDFEQHNYKSMDKQVLRDYGKEQNWKAFKDANDPGALLVTSIPEEIKLEVMSAYILVQQKLCNM